MARSLLSTGCVSSGAGFTHRTRVFFPLMAVALFAFPLAAHGQWNHAPERGGRIFSLGQPRAVRWQAGLAAGPVLDRPRDELTVRGQIGFTRDLMNPVAGLASISLEAYFGARAAAADGGARVLFPIPYFGIGGGADYNFRDTELALLITAYSPVRRGGIIVPGGLARVDWYPTRNHSFTAGFSVPLGDRFAGRGRPLLDHIVVAADFQPRVRYQVSDAEIDAVLDSLRISAEWIRRLVVPFLDQDGRNAAISLRRTEAYLNELGQHLEIRNAEREVRYFHTQLERAFIIAAGSDDAGRQLTRAARAILLDDVIFPYNRLLGRKKRNDTLADLSTAARGRFSRWAVASGVVSAERTDHALFVFQQLTDVIDDVRRAAAKEWDDPRLVWLPLQYALLPEDHDDKSELDGLLERATDVRFRNPTRVRYLANLQFHWELLRSIQETRNYHVLWIHDFVAVTSDGYDAASLSQVVDGYLTTLANRVESYDTTGSLPTFFIFLDQHYYEQRNSRWLMNVLEDPLSKSLKLPPGLGENERLLAAQQRLRTAVRGSRVLNAEARQYGDAWLRNRIKVHVNVTNRPDPSFWSGSLIATLFGYPDNVMRDHRKIVFRDVSESDPAAGIAILTGMGVGQHYLGPTWEDRSLIIEGSMLVELKCAAHDLLVSQGMREPDLPVALRCATESSGSAEQPGTDEIDTPAMLLVNGTGYLSKPLNVGKALLYSMAPSGSVMKIPDALWNSTFYGALLVGAGLRGARVSVMAPAGANAPSGGFAQMSRARELFSRFLLARNELAAAMHDAGGGLIIGLYALPVDQDGFASRAALWAQQLSSQPSLRSLLPFDMDVLPVVAAVGARNPAVMASDDSIGTATGEPPKLHMKVQFFATRELWESIARSPDWSAFMSTYLTYREATYRITDSPVAATQLPDELARIGRKVFEQAHGQSRAAAYAIVGSQNQDYRGMFMDGEVAVLFSGFQSLVPLLDLTFVEGTATLVENQATLDRLIPPVGELKRRFARVAKDAI